MIDLLNKLNDFNVPAELINQLGDLIVRDQLTGLFNRRFFDENLEKSISFAERYNQPLALIFIDLDNFKKINDNQGYSAGDEALKNFARTLEKTCRKSDFICRFGGDEFAVILPNTDKKGAESAVTRIRKNMPQNISASFGISTLPDELLSFAQKAMMKQKNR